eukprot:2181111-Prymnesium_polylepis.1
MLSNSALVPADAAAEVGPQLADVFWFIGLELEAEQPKREGARKAFTRLVAASQRDGVVPADVLKVRLEAEVLQEAGLIESAQDFHKLQVRKNTKDFYTTQKYNLLREESEGYSKLITELSELPVPAGDGTSTRGCKNGAEVISNIQSL